MAIEVNSDQLNSIVRNTPPGPRRDALIAALGSAPSGTVAPATKSPSIPSTATTVDDRLRLQQAKNDARLQMMQARAQEAEAKAKTEQLRAANRQQELTMRQQIRQENDAAKAAASEAREDRRKEREAQQAEKRMAATAAQQRTARMRQIEKTGALLPAHPALHSTSILPTDKDVRFLDAGLVAAAGAGTALWTASRKTTMEQVGWGLGWVVLGTLAAVQSSAELQYFGFGMLGANAGVLALRMIHPDLHPPQPAQQSAFVGMVTSPQRQS